MISATFTVNGNTNPAAHVVSYGSTVNLELLSYSGATSITWSVMSCSLAGQSLPATSVSGTPSGRFASFVMPSDPGGGLGLTFVVKCEVSSETKDSSGAREKAVGYAVVGVPNSRGIVPIAPDEKNYRNATHGWSQEINVALNNTAGSGGVVVASGTETTSSFIQPSIGGTVSVQVDNSSGFLSESVIYITSGGYYTITDVPNSTHVTVVNLGTPGNADPGVTIASGSPVVTSGSPVSTAAQSSIDLFTLQGVQNVKVKTHIHLTDYPWNAKASTATSTFSCTSGSPTVTLSASGDWSNRDGIFLPRAGSAPVMITPPAATASVRGTTGATSRVYKIAGMTASFAITSASASVTPTNTNATLSDTNYVRITPQQTPMVDGYVNTNVANLSAFTVAQPNRTYIAGETVWLRGQTVAGQMGPYTVGTVTGGTAPLTRATWCDSAAEATALSGYFVPVRASRAFGSGSAGVPKMLQITSTTIGTLGTDPITTTDELEMILVYVNDSRTGGNDRLIGGIATRADWYTSTVVPHFHFDDIGEAVSSPDSWIPNSASATPITGSLIARVIAGGGTTTLTIDRNAVTTVASNTARHDNTLALQEAIDSCSTQGSDVGRRIVIPETTSTYRMHSVVEVDKQIDLSGMGQDSTKLEWCGGTGWLRVRGQTLSRFASSAFGAEISRLWLTSTNRLLPCGGDYVSTPYEGGTGATYDPVTQLYTGGGYSDVRKLSWFQGAGVLVHTQCTFRAMRSSFSHSTQCVISGTSDDTGSNANNAEIYGWILSSILHGHGVAVHGYDSSNGRYYNIRTTGATNGATFWDQSFTGCHWYSPHGEACYLACMFAGSATAGEMFGPYFEGGMQRGRGTGAVMSFGGTFGTGLDSIQSLAGGKFTAGLNYTHGSTPNRIYRQFGDANGGFIEQMQSEDAELDLNPLRLNWNPTGGVKEIQRYLGATSYIVDAVTTLSTKVWGGVAYARGFLLGSGSSRRAVRMISGAPTTALNMWFEPGDITFDSNTGARIRCKAACVCTTNVWSAGTTRVKGTPLAPTVNNALNRGFVCETAGTSHATTEPNWNAAADGATVTDGTVVWRVVGTTGSAVPQFHGIDLGGINEDEGSNLSDADLTITVAQGRVRELPVNTYTGDRTVTLSTTGAVKGDSITIVRYDVTGFKMTVVNGGAGAGSRVMQGGREQSWTYRFDGTNWKLRISGSSEVRRFISTGSNLTDADATITVAQGNRRVRLSGTQTNNRTVTLSTSGAVAGDTILIECEAQATHTLAIVDNGPGTPTRFTVPAGEAWAVELTFDGTNWGPGAYLKKWKITT